MVDQTSELEALEHILGDLSAEPTKLSYAVLQSITNNFCKVIGYGGFAVVYREGCCEEASRTA
jgi:enhancer of mRNA-decapping protein 4/coatomer subunit beta'